MTPSEIRSARHSRRVETLWAVVIVTEGGVEGIVRLNVPGGTLPHITDDERLVPTLLEIAMEKFPGETIRVVKFARFP